MLALEIISIHRLGRLWHPSKSLPTTMSTTCSIIPNQINIDQHSSIRVCLNIEDSGTDRVKTHKDQREEVAVTKGALRLCKGHRISLSRAPIKQAREIRILMWRKNNNKVIGYSSL